MVLIKCLYLVCFVKKDINIITQRITVDSEMWSNCYTSAITTADVIYYCSLTSSSCWFSELEWPATLYRSTTSPSMPSPSTGSWLATAARAWHRCTRAGSQAERSWHSSSSTHTCARWGRTFSMRTRANSAICRGEEEEQQRGGRNINIKCRGKNSCQNKKMSL